MADTSVTIHPVTQDTSAGCPPSHETLSAMSLESLSAISGMRSWRALLAAGKVKDPGLDPGPQWQKRKRSGDALRKIDYWVR